MNISTFAESADVMYFIHLEYLTNKQFESVYGNAKKYMQKYIAHKYPCSDGGRINYGYYIVEPVFKPEYVRLECKKILTASTCLCNQHPSLYGSFWDNHKEEQTEYQKLLKLSDKEFESIKETVSFMFNEHKLDHDSRFAELSDAQNFYNNYLQVKKK